MASITGASNLIDEMSDDIHKMEKKLYKYHWNEKEGLFSYYDKENQSFFKLNGEEANKGLDGYYPLVSSSVPQETASAFAQKLFDPEKFLTNYGITTVDKTAKYFREDGYWNGHVWVPHNWFIWKALLDYGYASQARLLAKRLFKGFCDAFYRSGNIVECLHHETGQEEHVPFFSGLNGQLFNLYKAYSGKNVFSVSSGFQSYAKLKQKGRKIELEIISPFFKGKSAFVLNLKPNKKYQIFEEGAQVAKFKTDGSASADICLQLTKNSHQYEISECLNPH
jgi:hypothetical protein